MAPDQSKRLDRLERLAARMDMAFRIPFAGIRLGWDSILGVVPGLGDTATLAPAAYIIVEAHRMGAPKWIIARMAANTGVDWLVGLIPLVGDILDVGVKSNMRNVAVLRAHMNRTAASTDETSTAETQKGSPEQAAPKSL